MLAIVRKRILNLPLKWENVGNTNLNYGYDLYSNTILNLIEENVLDKDLGNEFLDELKENLNFFTNL